MFNMNDENLSVGDAMKKSKELTDGYKWQLFGKGFGYFFVTMLALIPLFVVMMTLGAMASMLLNALTMLTMLVYANELKRIKGQTSAAAPAPALQ